MNAQALFQIVKDWPREAWPNDIDIEEGKGGWWYDTDSTSEISDDHAVMLFESAGLTWLIGDHSRKTPIIRTYRYGNDFLVDVDGSRFVAPTLIEAISKAIQEAK